MNTSRWAFVSLLVVGCVAGGGASPSDRADTDDAPDTDLGDTGIATDPTPGPDTAADTDGPAGTDTADTDSAADTDPLPDTDSAADTDTDAPAVCGDGRITAPEACDDQHDFIPYDGCTGCQVDNGWWCYGEPSYCVIL